MKPIYVWNRQAGGFVLIPIEGGYGSGERSRNVGERLRALEKPIHLSILHYRIQGFHELFQVAAGSLRTLL